MAFALLFPGQGSQSLKMMDGFANFATAKETFCEASDILATDFWAMLQNDDQAIHLTHHTQPLILTAGVAIWRIWKEEGGENPAVAAGHSLGEYSALVASGTIAFQDALPLVYLRAQVMQEAVPQGTGAMAAILGLDSQTVIALCEEAAKQGVVEAANFNTPEQIVISGEKLAVEHAMSLAKEKGAKRALLLPVSVPSHCTLMKPAAEKLADALGKLSLQTPLFPVLHNIDAKPRSSTQAILQALVAQLYQPVRWTEVIEAIARLGITQLAECGPGKVLTGLTKRINDQLHSLALTDEAALLLAKTAFEDAC